MGWTGGSDCAFGEIPGDAGSEPMLSPIISVENLSKRYLLGHKTESRERYTALRDVVVRRTKSLIRLAADTVRGQQVLFGDEVEEFWALRDVSFEVQSGEVVGVIGRNGAGKSTLLKVLSRITDPTEGRITLRGRIASLLEVGTGFHPELTGRENIFLNGAILGMTRQEIRQKFDEIVAFAEVEKFLDTPVKRYSSGMYVRLAFAVAAHLEPEILVVDEVLAVGDAEFQKKCLGKMQEVSRGGRTVLFVSHQMAAVQALCDRGIFLSGGRIVKQGLVGEVIRHYLSESDQRSQLCLVDRHDRQGSGVLRFTDVSFYNEAKENVGSLTSGAAASIEFRISNSSGKTVRNVRVCLAVDTVFGQRLMVFSTHLADQDFAELPAGAFRITLDIECLALIPGRYSFNLYSTVNNDVADWIRNAGYIDVEGGNYYGNGQLPTQDQGCVMMRHEFKLRQGD